MQPQLKPSCKYKPHDVCPFWCILGSCKRVTTTNAQNDVKCIEGLHGIQIEQLINEDPVEFNYAWDVLVYFEKTIESKSQSEDTHSTNNLNAHDRSDCNFDQLILLATIYQHMANLSAM